MKRILIVEDNLTLSRLLKEWLSKEGYEVETAFDEPYARNQVRKGHFDMILSDVRLPEGNGLKLLEWLHKEYILLPFVVMTEYASYPDAVHAVKLGAIDYLPKPVYREQLLELVHGLLKPPSVIKNEKKILKRSSPQAIEVERLAGLVAPSDMSVLILGASGSGKESVAQSIHQNSGRRDKPFVAVNCGGIPKELVVSEFFGHVKGAFTGAETDVKGYFEMAHGGTLFLDEIGNMSHELQILLLRVLQEHVYSPVGSRRQYHSDIRIISATNEDMEKTVQEGHFREDLYHRLNEFELMQPSLYQCREDIMPLANFFRERFSKELRRETLGFTKEAEAKLLSYSWPGNIRELRNKIKRAVLITEELLLSVIDIGLDQCKEGRHMDKSTEDSLKQDMKLKSVEKEKEKIIRTMEESGNNLTQTAALLGISRTSLYNKLRKYGIR